MSTKLTDQIARTALAPASGNRITYDTEVRGFGVRVTAAGVKSFVLNYHIGGREKRITIGRYPEWTVLAARRKAKELRTEIDQGIDPLGVRQEDRSAATVQDLWRRYEREHLPRLAPKTRRDISAMWSQWILKRLGTEKLKDITSSDIDLLHALISADAPVRANRVLQTFRSALSLAVRWGWISKNPVDGFRRNHEQPRHRYLSADEIERLLKALDELENQKAADAIRLLLLTGARRSEVLKAEWSQFDLQEGTWVKPSTHTKQRREHRVPLSVPAVELLRRMRTKAKGEYLFPTASNTPIPDIKRPWSAACKTADLDDVRLHDLRHTYASILASEGYSLPTIGHLLGHTQAATTHRYSHLFDDPLRQATSRAAQKIVGHTS